MSTTVQRSRQARAQEQLERQLKLGTKNTKEGVVNLSEKDVKRIKVEIDNLKKKR